jgi:hypothetical protein
VHSRIRIVATLLAAAGLVAAATGNASASKPSSAYQPPVVEWVSPVVHALANGSAVVHGKYRCSGGNAGTHLYIGVKQGPLVNATDHTSSEFARTFYSTNWNSDGPGLSLICDGRSHNVSFVVKPDAFFWNADNAPPLASGQAFVQFCLFDSTGNDQTGFAFDYSMRKVVLNG